MPRPGRMTTERAKDFKGTLRQLLQTMSHYKLPLITAIVFAILSTIFNIAGPKAVSYTHLDVYKRQPHNYLQRCRPYGS